MLYMQRILDHPTYRWECLKGLDGYTVSEDREWSSHGTYATYGISQIRYDVIASISKNGF